MDNTHSDVDTVDDTGDLDSTVAVRHSYVAI